jgi:hypothetical protein
MRILALIQGEWGKRKVKNIKAHAPSDWKIEALEIPLIKLPFLDDPEEYLTEGLNPQDLILSLGEEPALADLVVEVARRTKAKAVIAPVDNREWMPPGLVNQLKKDLAKSGIAFAAPVPFCTLTEKDSENEFIRLFAKYFGRPALEISCSEGKIQEVKVLRDCPCGNTHHVGQQLKGVPLREAENKAGLAHHYYPCWSTMAMDAEFGDTLMHRAGLMTKLAVEKALEQYRKAHTSYINPR